MFVFSLTVSSFRGITASWETSTCGTPLSPSGFIPPLSPLPWATSLEPHASSTPWPGTTCLVGSTTISCLGCLSHNWKFKWKLFFFFWWRHWRVSFVTPNHSMEVWQNNLDSESTYCHLLDLIFKLCVTHLNITNFSTGSFHWTFSPSALCTYVCFWLRS